MYCLLLNGEDNTFETTKESKYLKLLKYFIVIIANIIASSAPVAFNYYIAIAIEHIIDFRKYIYEENKYRFLKIINKIYKHLN